MTITARVTKLPDCDICKMVDDPIKPAQYDGMTILGRWAYMCPVHFLSHGSGLGLGKGQRLITESEHTDEDLNRADRLCLKCGKRCDPSSYNVEETRHRILEQPQKIELMLMTGLYCEEVLDF